MPFGHTQGKPSLAQGGQRGDIAQTALLVIVIVGGFFLAGGFFPSNFLDSTQTPIDGVLDENQTSTSKESLQLGTLKFKKCSSIITMDLLLDVSGSMDDPTTSGVKKIKRLQQAVLSLINDLSDESIIGVQTFRGTGPVTAPPVSQLIDVVPISFYKEVKSILPGSINGLTANGSTPTYDALAFSRDQLAEAQTKFPDRKFNFILISDGAPCPGTCPSIPGENQDPRLYTPNPADEIKALGVDIYTVGIYTGNPFGIGGGQNEKLRQLLIDTASKPENYFESTSGDDVSSLLSQISNKICEGDVASPTP